MCVEAGELIVICAGGRQAEASKASNFPTMSMRQLGVWT